MAVGDPNPVVDYVGTDTPTLDAIVAELPAVGALTMIALAAIWLAWRAIVALERTARDTRERADPDELDDDRLP